MDAQQMINMFNTHIKSLQDFEVVADENKLCLTDFQLGKIAGIKLQLNRSIEELETTP